MISFKIMITAMAHVLHAVCSLIILRIPVFRHRYVFTRDGHLRLRYCLALSVIGVVAGVMAAPQIQARLPVQVADMPHTIPEVAHIEAKQQPDAVVEDLLSAIEPDIVVEETPPNQWQETISFAAGDTIGSLLNNRDVGMAEVNALITAMKPYIKPQDFKVGQSIQAAFQRTEDGATLDQVTLELSPIKTVTLTRADDGFQATLQEVELIEEKRVAKATVDTSLYADLRKQGVPDSIIGRMIKAYAWSVDFQRDIWGGETIELLYTVETTEDGRLTRGGELLFANLTLRGKESPIYLFERKDGRVDYYTPSGRSVKKALLRTPVDGARISSGYGMRKHPILGYNKMHKGVDFAAPTGTPIYAAGDGIVEKRYRSKTFGNYIRIRHNDTYKTAYAHLHRFAKGIREGSRVRQGQVIGTVGSTGRSTGPHLHYEVHKNGKQVNPRSVNLPIGDRLAGTELANFKNAMRSLDRQFVRLDPDAPKSLAQASE